MDSIIEKNRLNIWMLGNSSSVVVARTLSSSQPPQAWSDHFLTYQRLSLEVQESLTGQPLSDKFELFVPVVERSKIAGSTPGLASWLATPGLIAVYFIRENRIVDLDIGVFEGSGDNIKLIRSLCQGPMPTGVGSTLYTLCTLSETQTQVKAAFAQLLPTVMDAFDPGQLVARLTVVKSKLRVFTGVRLERVLASRGPDLTVRATAAQWAEVLTGRSPMERLATTGTAPQLVSALNQVGQLLGSNKGLCEQIKVAAGA
jgi:hypothetical protein